MDNPQAVLFAFRTAAVAGSAGAGAAYPTPADGQGPNLAAHIASILPPRKTAPPNTLYAVRTSTNNLFNLLGSNITRSKPAPKDAATTEANAISALITAGSRNTSGAIHCSG